MLGLYDLFADRIIHCDYSLPNFACKPEPLAYHRAMKIAGEEDHAQCLLIDDSRLNIDTAQQLGWGTVWVESVLPEDISALRIRAVHRLPAVLSSIFDNAYLDSYLAFETGRANLTTETLVSEPEELHLDEPLGATDGFVLQLDAEVGQIFLGVGDSLDDIPPLVVEDEDDDDLLESELDLADDGHDDHDDDDDDEGDEEHD